MPLQTVYGTNYKNNWYFDKVYQGSATDIKNNIDSDKQNILYGRTILVKPNDLNAFVLRRAEDTKRLGLGDFKNKTAYSSFYYQDVNNQGIKGYEFIGFIYSEVFKYKLDTRISADEYIFYKINLKDNPDIYNNTSIQKYVYSSDQQIAIPAESLDPNKDYYIYINPLDMEETEYQLSSVPILFLKET